MNQTGLMIPALAAVLLAAPTVLPAQSTPPATGQACSAPERRQFDFWIGDWDVTTPDGKPAGHNLIEPILQGCALRESWTGVEGMSGTSYNMYDRRNRKWHQTWVDDRGSMLLLDGAFAGGKMVLSGEVRDSSGTRVINRITWTETAPGAVRQVWEMSRDGGGTWVVAFDGRYRKRGG